MDEDIAPHIKPDYNKSVSEVFKDAAVQLMTHSKSLIFLNLTTYTLKDSRLLPTWIPTWHTLDGSEVLPWLHKTARLSFYKLFNACGNKVARFKVQQGNVLNLTGIQLDHVLISGIGGAMASLSTASEILETLSEWRRLSRADAPEQSSYVAGGKALDAFWRVLSSDLVPINIYNLDELWRRCQSKDEKTYLEWLSALREQGNDRLNALPSYLVMAYHYVFQRTCCAR
jgi:hypothetical protein